MKLGAKIYLLLLGFLFVIFSPVEVLIEFIIALLGVLFVLSIVIAGILALDF